MATASPSPSLLRRLGRGFVDYWRRIGDDYRTVAKETAEACVKKPFKAECNKSVGADRTPQLTTARKKPRFSWPSSVMVYGFYFTGLGTLVYAYRTNPSELRTMNELRELRQRMTMLPASIHNKETDAELAERSLLISQHRLHYYNLWFFSLLVQSPHDSSVRIYKSQDPNLKDWAVVEFFNNIYDVGVFGRWRRLEEKFKEYDVNREELAGLPD